MRGFPISVDSCCRRVGSSLVDLAGRNALVTGVSRRAGIGYAIARRLLEAGTAVFVQGWTLHDETQPWGAEPGGTESVASELGVPFVEADFADAEAPERVVAAAAEALGPLDVLVVNHARSGHGPGKSCLAFVPGTANLFARDSS